MMMTDNSVNSWFSDMGMEDPFSSDHYDINDFLNEDFTALGEDLQTSFPSPTAISNSSTSIPSSNSTNTLCASAMEVPPVCVEGPAKKRKSNNKYNSSTNQKVRKSASTPIILKFGNQDSPEMNPNKKGNDQGILNTDNDSSEYEILTSQGSLEEEAAKSKKNGRRVRPASQTYDHIIAERKRREQLSKYFVALSAIVPGLKKMDKTSVLGDAITYLKSLKERVNTLEEHTKKQTMESVVLVKKSKVFLEDEGSSDEMPPRGFKEHSLPEIEVKLCDKSVLIKIHCEKTKGSLVNTLSQLENLNLVVTNTNVSAFGSFALDITIVAQMEKESKLTMKELVQTLRSALQRAN